MYSSSLCFWFLIIPKCNCLNCDFCDWYNYHDKRQIFWPEVRSCLAQIPGFLRTAWNGIACPLPSGSRANTWVRPYVAYVALFSHSLVPAFIKLFLQPTSRFLVKKGGLDVLIIMKWSEIFFAGMRLTGSIQRLSGPPGRAVATGGKGSDG